MTIYINLDEEKITDKVTNDELGLFISNEWKRLIDPYTPRDTGTLMGLTNQVELRPFKIWYKSKYAVYVYYGDKMNFRKINPFSVFTIGEYATSMLMESNHELPPNTVSTPPFCG